MALTYVIVKIFTVKIWMEYQLVHGEHLLPVWVRLIDGCLPQVDSQISDISAIAAKTQTKQRKKPNTNCVTRQA